MFTSYSIIYLKSEYIQTLSEKLRFGWMNNPAMKDLVKFQEGVRWQGIRRKADDCTDEYTFKAAEVVRYLNPLV